MISTIVPSGLIPVAIKPLSSKCLAVGVVELVAVAVPLVDLVDAVRLAGQAVRAPGRRATSPAASCRRARGPTAALPSAR